MISEKEYNIGGGERRGIEEVNIVIPSVEILYHM